MSLLTPPKVHKLREALHAKAKGSPAYRFYALYDKLYRADILAHACACCKANRGAAGVDGQGFADIEAYGRERWLGELTGELRNKTYRPQAVRRVWIPKPDGTKRPLGIPTIKDRDESFDFLGYTIGRCYSTKTGKSYIGTRPSRKQVTRLCQTISEMTGRRWTLLEAQDRVVRLNRAMLGQLLLSGPGQQSLPSGGRPRSVPAAPVVAVQAQGSGRGDRTLPRRVSLRDTRTRPT